MSGAGGNTRTVFSSRLDIMSSIELINSSVVRQFACTFAITLGLGIIGFWVFGTAPHKVVEPRGRVDRVEDEAAIAETLADNQASLPTSIEETAASNSQESESNASDLTGGARLAQARRISDADTAAIEPAGYSPNTAFSTLAMNNPVTRLPRMAAQSSEVETGESVPANPVASHVSPPAPSQSAPGDSGDATSQPTRGRRMVGFTQEEQIYRALYGWGAYSAAANPNAVP